MRTTLTVVGVVLFALVVSWPSSASAELPRPYGKTTGFVIEAGFGGNGITSDDYVDDALPAVLWPAAFFGDKDVRPMVGLFIDGAYRPINWVSVGLLLHYGFLNGDFDNIDHDTSGFFGALIEVRGHLPVSRFDPWVGFGFGYAMTFSHGWGDRGGIDYDGRVALHGVGLGVSLGLNIFITRQLALAPFFRMIMGIFPGGCARYDSDTGDDQDCDNLDDLYADNPPDDFPHLWIVGLSASYVVD